jgi:hypothetical protein
LDNDREVEMVELFEDNVKLFNRHSSKGNQLKWEKDGVWYKADYTGYEGLAEYMISQLLKKSTLKKDEFVIYEPEQIKYKRKIFNGAKSDNFLNDDWQLVTLQRLYKTRYNRSFIEDVWHIPETTDRLKFVVEQVEQITKLENFGIYMCKLLTIDAFFLNEDRHMHNIAVLMNGEGKNRLCPFFDQGAGLLSDTALDYPLGDDAVAMMGEVNAKTICSGFEEALEAAEQLYGYNLKFSFTKKDVEELINNVGIYSDEEKARVKTIIFQQMRRYEYLF